MPYYSIYNGRHRVACVECTTHGTIKAATGRFVWSVGKPVTALNEWLCRHHMRTVAAEGVHDIDLCKLDLKPQKELPSMTGG